MSGTDIVSVLREHAVRRPDQVAVRLAEYRARELHVTEITYREMDRIASARAAWIRRHTVPDRPVLVVLSHGREQVLDIIACLYARVVVSVCPTPSGRAHQDERLGLIVLDSGADLILTEPELVGRVSADLESVTGRLRVAVCGEDAGDYEPAPVALSDIAILQYTSGSISAPQGVAVHHGALLDNLTTIEHSYAATSDGEFCGWLPLYHDMGLIGQLLCPLHTGATTTMMSALSFVRRPVRWLQLIDRFRAGYSAAPNFALTLCLRTLRDDDLEGLDLSCWKVLYDGAEPVNPTIVRDFAERLAPFGLSAATVKATYGLAEATVFVAGTPLDESMVTRWVDEELLGRNRLAEPASPSGVELVSCGPVPTLEVLIVDPDTHQPLPADQVGEIWLRGQSVATGYWRSPTSPEFNAHTQDGAGPYLRTGDLGARRDQEFFVTGRLKDLVIINGRNIYPTDVELMVGDLHAALRDQTGAFVSVASGPEEVVMVQEINTSALGAFPLADLANLIRDHITRRLGVPVGCVVLAPPGTVPRTTSGKIRRRAVADHLRDGNLPVLHENLSTTFAERFRQLPGPA